MMFTPQLIREPKTWDFYPCTFHQIWISVLDLVPNYLVPHSWKICSHICDLLKLEISVRILKWKSLDLNGAWLYNIGLRTFRHHCIWQPRPHKSHRTGHTHNLLRPTEQSVRRSCRVNCVVQWHSVSRCQGEKKKNMSSVNHLNYLYRADKDAFFLT